MTYEVGESYEGMSITEDFCVIDIEEDNTLTITMMGSSAEGTWSTNEDGNVVLTIEGEDVVVTISGSQLTMSGDGVTIVFKKQ